jgi:DNA-binding NtrC family response regulator
MLMICRAILEANGYSVLTASEVEVGLELLKHNMVNAAVIDDGLKDMSASKLALEMHQICPALLVVVFSRSSRSEGAVSAREICVPKADGPKALLAAIQRGCEGSFGLQS